MEKVRFKRTLGIMLTLLAILPGLTGNYTSQVEAYIHTRTYSPNPQEVTTAPSKPYHIYSDGTYLFIGTGDGKVYRSDDDGETWTEILNVGSTIKMCYLLEKDNYGNLWTSFDNYKLYRSSDNGDSWSIVIDLSVGDPTFGYHTTGGFFDIKNGTFISALRTGNDPVIYRSDNYGVNWYLWKNFTEIFPEYGVVDPNNPSFIAMRHTHITYYFNQTFYVSVGDYVRQHYNSTDNGQTWQVDHLSTFTSVYVMEDRVLLGVDMGDSGIWMYKDGKYKKVYNPHKDVRPYIVFRHFAQDSENDIIYVPIGYSEDPDQTILASPDKGETWFNFINITQTQNYGIVQVEVHKNYLWYVIGYKTYKLPKPSRAELINSVKDDALLLNAYENIYSYTSSVGRAYRNVNVSISNLTWTNLTPNPSFESFTDNTPTNWMFSEESWSGTSSRGQEITDVYHGSKAYYIEAGDGNGFITTHSDLFSVSAGYYYLGTYFKANSSWFKGIIKLSLYTTTDGWKNRYVRFHNTNGTWQQVGTSFYLTTTQNAKVYITIQSPTDYNITTKVIFDSVVLVGNEIDKVFQLDYWTGNLTSTSGSIEINGETFALTSLPTTISLSQYLVGEIKAKLTNAKLVTLTITGTEVATVQNGSLLGIENNVYKGRYYTGFSITKNTENKLMVLFDQLSTVNSISLALNKLTFTVSAPSGTTSTTEVYCSDRGEPAAVYATNGTLTWSYNASKKMLRLNLLHYGPAEIVVYWRNPGQGDQPWWLRAGRVSHHLANAFFSENELAVDYTLPLVVENDLLFAVRPPDGRTLMSSTDKGQTWTSLYTFPDTITNLHYTSNGILFASIFPNIIPEGRIYRSLDKGKSFSLVLTLQTSCVATYFSISSVGPKLLVGEYGPETTFGKKVYLSNDNGTSWTTVLTGRVITGGTVHFHAVYIDPFTGDFWAAEGDWMHGLYYSSNSGVSWSLYYDGILIPTSIIATSRYVFFGKDAQPRLIFRYDKITKTFEQVETQTGIDKYHGMVFAMMVYNNVLYAFSITQFWYPNRNFTLWVSPLSSRGEAWAVLKYFLDLEERDAAPAPWFSGTTPDGYFYINTYDRNLTRVRALTEDEAEELVYGLPAIGTTHNLVLYNGSITGFDMRRHWAPLQPKIRFVGLRSPIVNNLTNPSFEKGLQNWTILRDVGDASEVSVINNTATIHGSNILNVKKSPFRYRTGVFSDLFRIDPGAKFCLSFYAKGNITLPRSLSLAVKVYDSAKSLLGQYAYVWFNLTTSWRRYTMSNWVLREGFWDEIRYINVGILTNSTTTHADIMIDAVQFEYIKKYSDAHERWLPSMPTWEFPTQFYDSEDVSTNPSLKINGKKFEFVGELDEDQASEWMSAPADLFWNITDVRVTHPKAKTSRRVMLEIKVEPEIPYIQYSEAKIVSASFAGGRLIFSITTPSRATSTTKVYCGDKGEPTAVYATNGTLTWGYNATTTILTLSVVHDGPASILIDWKIPGDIDGDGYVGSADFSILAGAYGSSVGDPAYNSEADIDGDGSVGSADFSILAGNYGKTKL